MTGSDLKCECGERAIDVADIELDPMRSAILWTCASGHRQIIGFRDMTGHVEAMRVTPTRRRTHSGTPNEKR